MSENSDTQRPDLRVVGENTDERPEENVEQAQDVGPALDHLQAQLQAMLATMQSLRQRIFALEMEIVDRDSVIAALQGQLQGVQPS